MAKTIDDLINSFDNLEAELKTELPKITLEYAGNAVALAFQRVEKEGAKPGAKYSEEPMYATQAVFNNKGAFKPRGKNVKGKKAKFKQGGTQKVLGIAKAPKLRESMYLEHGYKELRQIQGLQTSVVDLEYTGRMHQNTNPLGIETKSEFSMTAVVGATNEEEKKKLKANFKRYGNFLRVTPEIQEEINPIVIDRIKDIMRQVFSS